MNSEIAGLAAKTVTGILAVALWTALVYLSVKGAEALIFFLQSYVTALLYHTGVQIATPGKSTSTHQGEAP
jgi:hypothetical protein